MTARPRPPESPRENSEGCEPVENAKGAMDKFKALTGGLVKVTREEVEREERRYQKTQAAKRKARGL
jgi:hypothetical protein